MLKTIETQDCIAKYEDTPEIREKVFLRVLEYFKKNEAFLGEVIHQSDDCIIDAPSVLSDIADKILKFEVSEKNS
jgi:hypothetical protein